MNSDKGLVSNTYVFRALSSSKSCPFDSKRDGFGLSEGAGLVILESLDSATKRGAKIYAEINGYGYF